MTKNMIESIAFAIIGLVLTISSLATKAGWEVTLLSVISLALACYCIYTELKSKKLCKCCCKEDVAPVVEAEPEVHIVETKPVKKTTTKKATTKKATTKAAPKKTTKKK